MRKRNKRIWAHLSDDEYDQFMERVKQSGLSMESYLRFLINGLVPKPKPPVDYYNMTNELRIIGKSIHEIAFRATVHHIIDAAEYERYSSQLDKQISAIQDAVELPCKIIYKDSQ